MHPTEVSPPMDLWDTQLKTLVRVSSVTETGVVAKPKDGGIHFYRGEDLKRLRKPTATEMHSR